MEALSANVNGDLSDLYSIPKSEDLYIFNISFPAAIAALIAISKLLETFLFFYTIIPAAMVELVIGSIKITLPVCLFLI